MRPEQYQYILMLYQQQQQKVQQNMSLQPQFPFSNTPSTNFQQLMTYAMLEQGYKKMKTNSP